MEEKLIKRLIETTALSSQVADRIWLIDRATPNLPAITVFVVDDGTEYSHDGVQDLKYARVQFDSWGATQGQATKLSRALFSELNSAQIVDNIAFEDAIQLTSRDMPRQTLDGGTPIFRVMKEFSIPYRTVG